MSKSRRQIPIKSGFILFGFFNLVIIGAGHGVGTIGIMLIAVPFFMEDFSLCLSNILLILGWPGILLLLLETLYAKEKKQMLRLSVFLIFSFLMSLSIVGLIAMSEVSEISIASSVPFFLAFLILSGRTIHKSVES